MTFCFSDYRKDETGDDFLGIRFVGDKPPLKTISDIVTIENQNLTVLYTHKVSEEESKHKQLNSNSMRAEVIWTGIESYIFYIMLCLLRILCYEIYLQTYRL